MPSFNIFSIETSPWASINQKILCNQPSKLSSELIALTGGLSVAIIMSNLITKAANTKIHKFSVDYS